MNIAVPAPQIVENKIICLNPVGYPPKVAKKSWRRGSKASTAKRSIWSTAASTIPSNC